MALFKLHLVIYAINSVDVQNETYMIVHVYHTLTHCSKTNVIRLQEVVKTVVTVVWAVTAVDGLVDSVGLVFLSTSCVQPVERNI